MYNSHEGGNFTPPGLGHASRENDTSSRFGNWLEGFLPEHNQEMLQKVEALYPLKGSTGTCSYSDQNQRAGLIYRDVILTCPASWGAEAAKTRGWLGGFTLAPVKHATDTVYVS
jgi:hypothetical protein